jgi:hypothetical protein
MSAVSDWNSTQGHVLNLGIYVDIDVSIFTHVTRMVLRCLGALRRLELWYRKTNGIRLLQAVVNAGNQTIFIERSRLERLPCRHLSTELQTLADIPGRHRPQSASSIVLTLPHNYHTITGVIRWLCCSCCRYNNAVSHLIRAFLCRTHRFTAWGRPKTHGPETGSPSMHVPESGGSTYCWNLLEQYSKMRHRLDADKLERTFNRNTQW